MKVTVYSRAEAAKLQPNQDIVLISVSSTKMRYDEVIPSEGWRHFMPIQFDDYTTKENFIEHNMPGSVIFNRELGQRVIDTVVKHAPAEFIIHCDAGISRSVAIGAFIRDYFSYDLELTVFKDDRSKNQLVYNVLRRIMMGIEDE